eukprot:7955242-Pyramimonas_sp.AAC.1
MRSFERRLDRQRVRTCVPDRMLRAGESSRYPDLELDPHRGATSRYPCVRHAGTMTPTARPRWRTGAREKPTSRMELVGAQLHADGRAQWLVPSPPGDAKSG